jgi:drug/metabolite transporter (DMT)-like permease
LGLLFLKERVDGRSAVAIACAASGIALLAGARDAGATAPEGWANAGVGNLLVFAAVLCEAAYAVIGKALTGSLTPRRISALINLWGLALVTPWGLWAAWDFDFETVPWGAWALLLFYGMAASVWSVWLWMAGLRAVPAARAGVFTVMLPVSAALVGVFAMGESPAPLQGLALGLALAGVVLATTPGRHAAGLREKGAPATPEGKQGPPQ